MKAIKRFAAAALLLTAAAGAASAANPSYEGVVFIGDSITARWPTELDFPRSVNVGIGGQICKRMWARFDEDVLARHPRAVVILCGTDDIRYYRSTSDGFELAMIAMAQRAGVKVIVGELPANTGWDVRLLTQEEGDELYHLWNAELTEASRIYDFSLVNYYAATLLPDGKQNKALFLPDGTHPNAAGYAVLTQTLRPILDHALLELRRDD